MKKKQRIALLGVILACALLITACGSATEKSSNPDGGQIIYGQISEIKDNSIILTLGEYDEESGEFTAGAETKEITVTDDTEIRMDNGGMSQEAGQDIGEMQQGGGEAPPEQSDGNGEAPPEKPDANGEAPPEKPDGSGEAPSEKGMVSDAQAAPPENLNQDGQNAPEEGMKQPPELSVETLSTGATVAVVLAEDGSAKSITLLGGMEKPGDMEESAGETTYTAVNEYTTDAEINGQTMESTGVDENAVLVKDGANVLLQDAVITRTSESSTGGENASFYGVGAAVLNTDGVLSISNSTITTDADGGAGVFSYGKGVAYVSDTKIKTSKNASGGIHVAGGGTLYAWNLNVETEGKNSAAIRSDRGSGTMVIDGGTYTSNEASSPAIYSTADITVKDATLTANQAEAICIEGLNTIRLFDCDLTGNMQEDEQNDCTWNVVLYQSMSGDSEEGNSTFEMVGGTLTAKNGGMFYTTNTESTIILDDVDIVNAENSDFFLRCTGNANQRGWGSSGSNGANCKLTAIKQEMEGNIFWDSISTLDFFVTDGSVFTGAILDDESYVENAGDGSCVVNLDQSATWVVTDDSTLTTLNNEGKIVDQNGKTVSILGVDGTVYVAGESNLTVTVSNYSTKADLSGASLADSFANYEVEQK